LDAERFGEIVTQHLEILPVVSHYATEFVNLMSDDFGSVTSIDSALETTAFYELGEHYNDGRFTGDRRTRLTLAIVHETSRLRKLLLLCKQVLGGRWR